MPAFFLSIGSIIIDDIILPDGTEKLGILGGGLTHAAMGIRVWTNRVGAVSSVGGNFDQDQLSLLASYFDISGVYINKNVPTPRAWQVFEWDGTRHETFQTDFTEMQACIPKPDDLPEVFSEIAGVHLHCPPHEVSLWVPKLRERGCRVILWEPWDEFCVPENLTMIKQNSRLVDIVSPNLREARLLTGLDDPADILRQLKAYGARIAVLRMADAGSLVLDENGAFHAIPAYPVDQIVDVTGAGNAFCGGFVFGYSKTNNAQQAGWHGGVSASLALHQFGALYPLDNIQQRAESRLNWYQQLAQ